LGKKIVDETVFPGASGLPFLSTAAKFRYGRHLGTPVWKLGQRITPIWVCPVLSKKEEHPYLIFLLMQWPCNFWTSF
jgi:hypothetical protein